MDLGDAGADGVAHHDYDDGQLAEIFSGNPRIGFLSGAKLWQRRLRRGKFPRRGLRRCNGQYLIAVGRGRDGGAGGDDFGSRG